MTLQLTLLRFLPNRFSPPDYGPRAVAGDFLSVSGPIRSAWHIGPNGTSVSLNVSLPVGVRRASVSVPCPFVANPSDERAVVTEGGAVVWDGKALVPKPGAPPPLHNMPPQLKPVPAALYFPHPTPPLFLMCSQPARKCLIHLSRSAE